MQIFFEANLFLKIIRIAQISLPFKIIIKILIKRMGGGGGLHI